MSIKGEWIYYDANYISASGTENLLVFENSIYEVVRVIDQIPLFLEDHLLRFEKSVQSLDVDFKIIPETLKEIIRELSVKNKMCNGNVKFELLLNQNVIPKLAICFVPEFYPPTEWYMNGIEVVSYEIERKNPHIKQSVVNNRVRVEIQALKDKKKLYEILLVNHKGEITEGSRSNVFFIKENALISPPSKEILEGITRKKTINLINQLNTKYIEKPIKLIDINEYDACFISGTSPKILPVNRINGICFNPQNSILQNLIINYNTLIDKYIFKSGKTKIE